MLRLPSLSFRVLLASLLLCGVATRASALDIPGNPSSCGIIVSRGDPGELRGDLDCTGLNPNRAIQLNPGATLHLNGFRVTSTVHGIVCETSVSPSQTCTIVGPGEITGAENGIAAVSRARIRNVTIHGNKNGIWKIYGDIPWVARLDLDHVVIRDNSGDGVSGGGAIHATDSSIRDNGGVGVTTYGPSRLQRTSITGNGGAGLITGIYSDYYQRYQYSPRKVFLVDADVSGNGVSDASADLVAVSRPNLKRSTCGTSANPSQPGSPPWGVCAGD
jgi:hypothetical protein